MSGIWCHNIQIKQTSSLFKVNLCRLWSAEVQFPAHKICFQQRQTKNLPSVWSGAVCMNSDMLIVPYS